MIRNILYSLFLHLAIALIVYTNLSFYRYQEDENEKEPKKVTLSFLVKVNQAEPIIEKKEKEEEKKEEPPKEAPKPKPKPKPKQENKPKKKEEKTELKKTADTKKKAPLPTVTKDETTNLTTQETAKIAEPQIVEEEKPIADSEVKSEDLPPITSTGLASEGNLPNLEEQIFSNSSLSLREKFNIQDQIKRCYKRAINEAGIDGKTAINVTARIQKDGTIDLDLLEIENFEKYNDPKEVDFHIAVDNARNAIILCSPLRNLPVDKYDIWRELKLKFDDGGVQRIDDDKELNQDNIKKADEEQILEDVI